MALSAKPRVAVSVPEVFGVMARTAEQLCPGMSDDPAAQEPPGKNVKSAALVPLMSGLLLRVRLPVPLLVRVTAWAGDAWPTHVKVPKFRVVALSEAMGVDACPMPVKLML